MKLFEAVLLIVMMFYKFFAIPAGLVFAFVLTRRLLGKHTALPAVGIALAWTVALFTPLVTPAQSFFDDLYAPWYLALMITPPAPQFSFGAFIIAIVVSLASGGFAVAVAKR